MSLGRLGAMCGCESGHTCTDCQIALPGLAAKWAVPTNYDPALHRHYLPHMGAYSLNQSPMKVMGMRGFGEVMLGDSGWTLGDAASLALIVLTAFSIWKELK